MREDSNSDNHRNMVSAITLPLFIRDRDVIERESQVDSERKRRTIRCNSMTSMIVGGALIGGSTAAILLSFFVAKGNGLSTIPSALIALFGYRLVASGTEEYMAASRTFSDACN